MGAIVCTLVKDSSRRYSQPNVLFTFTVVHLERLKVGGVQFQLEYSISITLVI